MLNRRTSVVGALLAGAVLVLAGCDADTGGTGGPKAEHGGASPGPAVIVPGKPGESAATMSAKDAAEKRSEDDSPNTADFTYTQMMIVHHGQALEMTELAPERAGSSRVKRLASRISSAQGPEIGAMKGWLEKHGGPREHAGHDHATMPGMASEAQLKQLRAARGKAFDELFLKLMITHHSGAITMATDVLSDGNNIQVEEMANDVVAQQSSEISRMRDME